MEMEIAIMKSKSTIMEKIMESTTIEKQMGTTMMENLMENGMENKFETRVRACVTVSMKNAYRLMLGRSVEKCQTNGHLTWPGCNNIPQPNFK